MCQNIQWNMWKALESSRAIKSNVRFSNEIELNRTIKFDVVRSSNEIELTKNKCESNQIERSIKFDEARFSSVAERYPSKLTSYHSIIWFEQSWSPYLVDLS